MDCHFSQIKARNSEIQIVTDNNTNNFTIENNRTSSNRIFRSITNPSVRIYMFVFALNSIAFGLYLKEIIK